MRIIITGAAGFIGYHAYEHHLCKQDDILVVDKFTSASNNKIKNNFKNLVEIDVSDRDFLYVAKDFRPDVILNFAAETHVDNSIIDSYDFVVTNVLGTSNILQACKELDVKLCQISTDEVYGSASNEPFYENSKLNPSNPYSATKASADMMIKAYHNTHKIKHVIIRPSNNYGPGQNKEKFIPKLIDCISNDCKFPLYGNGNQKRTWTYVKDTAKIIRQIINTEKKWSSIYNLGSNVTFKNVEIIQQVLTTYEKILKVQKKFEDVIQFIENRPGHDEKYWMSTSKLKSFINPNYTDFKIGLEETVESYVK